jgi:hypothetical protein
MNEIDILNELITNNAKISVSQSVTLIESECPDSKVVIKGIPNNSIIIKADAFTAPKSIFKNSRHECKRSDYVIVSDSGPKKRILIIEQKRTKDGEKAVIRQLKGSYCFIEYCKKIVSTFWNENKYLDTFEYRFISISHTSIPKQPTRTSKKSMHNTPETMLKISYPKNLQYNQLID